MPVVSLGYYSQQCMTNVRAVIMFIVILGNVNLGMAQTLSKIFAHGIGYEQLINTFICTQQRKKKEKRTTQKTG